MKRACRAPMPSKPPPGSSPWYPLHYLLCLDAAAYARQSEGSASSSSSSSAAATTAAFQAAAEPLVVRIVELFPECASKRIMEGVRFNMGNLPLELAISRGWPVGVVEAIIKAYPAGAKALDPEKKRKSFKPKDWKQPDSIKGCRWPRKIAEDMHPPPADEVLRLLPKPTKDIPTTCRFGL